MIAVLVAPFALSLALWRAAPRVVGRCSPRVTATTLSAASLIAALSTGLTLCAVATMTVTEIPALARLGGWSAPLLAARAPVPPLIGVGCGLVASVLLALSARHAIRTVRVLVATGRAGAALGEGANGLVIAPDEEPFAYAVPGWRGRTVISRGLLRRLDATERRAVLAHEEAHRRHRHFAYVQVSELAAAANPLLRPAARAVRLAVETWADDTAADVIGDRGSMARTLARVGLLAHDPAGGALPIAQSDLHRRVHALLTPPPRRSHLVALALVAATLVGGASATAVAISAHADFESAQAAYGPAH